jgi:DNA-binding response OmpR family regulator
MAGDVVLVRWPDERDVGAQLASGGVPVLYLVRATDDPPRPESWLEDWVRLPAEDRDLDARVAVLERRAAEHSGPPTIDEAGRLHFRGDALDLTPSAIALTELLLAHRGAVVHDEDLAAALREIDGARPLRTEMTQLRSSLRRLGVAVPRVRGRGYQLSSY